MSSNGAPAVEERTHIDFQLRMLDILLGALCLLLALPLILATALAILLTSGRPIFYRGERIGRGGHIFTMIKFRTLRPDAERRLGPYLGPELVERTRVETTSVGRFLRASQLDEIPQLWNVLRGDMSFVGPRPIRPRFFEQLAADIPAYWQRLVVRPGLTGFAQVRKGYESSWSAKLADDLEFIADRSVSLYLRTVLATGVRVLRQTFGDPTVSLFRTRLPEFVAQRRTMIEESRRHLIEAMRATDVQRR